MDTKINIVQLSKIQKQAGIWTKQDISSRYLGGVRRHKLKKSEQFDKKS